ncbi:MAG TPA: xanthine dehydrogenase family protein molybdopterin-binding subunit [Acidimicrobiales bacterium]|nr:xanthine dehydrogenase family protein molybdopterin-binding subunit [Acidimicrobiales bacterium]
MTQVGRSIRRLEDPRLVTGRGHFVDDLDRAGQVHARFVRASVAHAVLRGVEVSDALALDGVRAVISATDVDLPRIPLRVSPMVEGLEAYLQPALATGRLRYVGEPIAVVVADDPYAAEDAAELVEVDFEVLPCNLDPERSAGGEASELFEGRPNEVATLRASFGDVEAALGRAAHVIEIEVSIGRQTAVPIEPRGLLAEWDATTGSLEIWGATKVPHFNRRVIAAALGLDEDRVRLHAGDAGGGFGVRGELYPEDLIVAWLARALKRPVKWIEDRAEHLVTINHSRDQRHVLCAGFDADGILLALRDEVWHDNGAYLRTHGLTVPELTLSMLPGPYRLPAYEGVAHVVLTNKTPCGTLRAPGRYEGTFARERLFDEAAVKLGLDRLELRRMNLLRPDELPHDRNLRALGTDVVLDRGDYPGLLARAVERSGYRAWEEESRKLRAAGRLVGVGVAVFLEKSGLGPFETARVRVDPAGTVQVATGGTSLGQGIETVLAQIAADELGVDPATVEVTAGDTDALADGVGSWASRSTVVGGSAVHLAAKETGRLAREAAAELLEAAVEDIVLFDGRAGVLGSPARWLSLGELARARPEGATELAASSRFTVEHMTYPYGVHLAQVEIDGDTGDVRVPRYFVAYEVGRAINPTNVVGQIVGGAIQGIGGALLEEVVYTPDGQPLCTTLIDYILPVASGCVEVETLITEDFPSADNPLGAKGAGEGGLTAAGAAVASAVGDAIGDLGAPKRLPLTPERVLDLLAQRVRSQNTAVLPARGAPGSGD